MKNIALIFTVAFNTVFGIATLIVLCICLTAFPANAQKIINSNIDSKVLDQKREFAILLPKNYDEKSNKTYPVMYMLDSSSTISSKIASLSEKKVIPETILVGIRMINDTRDRDLLPPYMKSDLEQEDSPMGRADKLLKFMETELMPFMKKNYKTSDINALCGHSRGGVLIIYSLLARPSLFNARFAFSPAVWREDNLLATKAKEFLSLPQQSSSFLYMSLGENENDKMKNGFDALTQVFTKKPAKTIAWHSEYIKYANHQNNVELSISSGLEKWGEYLKR